MSHQSEMYSKHEAEHANLTLNLLGLISWEADDVKALQRQVGVQFSDGWFGPKSIACWKTWARKHQNETVPTELIEYEKGHVIVGNESFLPPEGVTVVNHIEPGGVPAQISDTGRRQVAPTQMLLHRGTETHRKGETYAQSTERVLDSKGCSTTFTMGPDGILYQHFDPKDRYGIHCRYHNRQSDSIDIAGPFDQKRKSVAGQEKITLKMAIGRKNDRKPPLARRYGTVKCWTMTDEQREALKAFLPWYCNLRGIPVRACEDWRTFRLSGKHGTKDPVTNVKGIIAHTQVAGPGSRVDGILPLHHLQLDGADIEWREAEDFFG